MNLTEKKKKPDILISKTQINRATKVTIIMYTVTNARNLKKDSVTGIVQHKKIDGLHSPLQDDDCVMNEHQACSYAVGSTWMHPRNALQFSSKTIKIVRK